MLKPEFKIVLSPEQEEHADRIYDTLHHYHGYVETSQTGSGKTYVTSAIANKMSLAMLVICPNQARKTWEDIQTKGAFVAKLFTQGEVRGKSGSVSTKFPYIRRETSQYYDENGELKTKETFVTTEIYDQLLDYGVFMVFDEVHTMKNEDSQITQVVAAMIERMVTRPKTKSRYVLISALLADSEENASSYAQLMGFYSGELVSYDPSTRTNTIKGLYDALDVFHWLNPEKYEEIIMMHNPIGPNTSGEEAKKIVFEMLINIVKPILFFNLPPLNIPSNLSATYFNMTDIEYKRYGIAVKALEEFTKFDPITGTVKKGKLSDNEAMLRDIELCKTGILVRETIKVLTKQPTSKVVILVNAIDTLNVLSSAFDALKVHHRIIYGKTGDNERSEIINTFQEPNLMLRLVIATMKTANMSISLHDTDGRFPRTTFILQRFGFMDTVQAAGRTIRKDTMSTPTVILVNGKHYLRSKQDPIDVQERRILNATDRKSAVAKAFHAGSGTVYPADYPQVVEDAEPAIANWYLPQLLTTGINALTPQEIEDILAGRSHYGAQTKRR